MTSTTEHPNLAAALSALQGELPTVFKGKTAKVPTKSGGNYSYSYADIADVTQAIMPLLSKHGLSFTCLPRMTERGYEIVGSLLHTSDPKWGLEGALPLYGSTSQEIGSAITYARRYLLGCLTGVVTDDDEDGSASTQATGRTGERLPDEQILTMIAKANTVDQVRAIWSKQVLTTASPELRKAAMDKVAVLEAVSTAESASFEENRD